MGRRTRNRRYSSSFTSKIQMSICFCKKGVMNVDDHISPQKWLQRLITNTFLPRRNLRHYLRRENYFFNEYAHFEIDQLFREDFHNLRREKRELMRWNAYLFWEFGSPPYIFHNWHEFWNDLYFDGYGIKRLFWCEHEHVHEQTRELSGNGISATN